MTVAEKKMGLSPNYHDPLLRDEESTIRSKSGIPSTK